MHALLYLVIACFVPAIALAVPISVGGFTFADGEAAFADDASLVSGSGVRFECAAGVPAATSFAGALSGSDVTQCVNVSGGGNGIVEVQFTNNSVLNGAGADLVIFELSGPKAPGTPDPRERFELSIFNGLAFSAFVAFNPVATGFHTPDRTLDIFAVAIDLSAFGLGPGAAIDRVRLHLFDNGLGSKGADIAALGALNSGPSVPEPSVVLLLMVAVAARRLTRMGPEVVKRQSSPHAAGGRPSSVVVSPRGPTSLRLRRSVAAPNTYRGSRRAHDGASAGSMCSAA